MAEVNKNFNRVNSVISREYVEKNYIHKDVIKQHLERQYELWNIPGKQKEYSQDVVNELEEILEDTKECTETNMETKK